MPETAPSSDAGQPDIVAPPTAPHPDVPDDLRERLISADLTSRVVTVIDSDVSGVVHTNEEAVDRTNGLDPLACIETAERVQGERAEREGR